MNDLTPKSIQTDIQQQKQNLSDVIALLEDSTRLFVTGAKERQFLNNKKVGFLGRVWMKIKSLLGCGALLNVMRLIEGRQNVFKILLEEKKEDASFNAKVRLLQKKVEHYGQNHKFWVSADLSAKVKGILTPQQAANASVQTNGNINSNDPVQNSGDSTSPSSTDKNSPNQNSGNKKPPSSIKTDEPVQTSGNNKPPSPIKTDEPVQTSGNNKLPSPIKTVAPVQTSGNNKLPSPIKTNEPIHNRPPAPSKTLQSDEATTPIHEIPPDKGIIKSEKFVIYFGEYSQYDLTKKSVTQQKSLCAVCAGAMIKPGKKEDEHEQAFINRSLLEMIGDQSFMQDLLAKRTIDGPTDVEDAVRYAGLKKMDDLPAGLGELASFLPAPHSFDNVLTFSRTVDDDLCFGQMIDTFKGSKASHAFVVGFGFTIGLEKLEGDQIKIADSHGATGIIEQLDSHLKYIHNDLTSKSYAFITSDRDTLVKFMKARFPSPTLAGETLGGEGVNAEAQENSVQLSLYTTNQAKTENADNNSKKNYADAGVKNDLPKIEPQPTQKKELDQEPQPVQQIDKSKEQPAKTNIMILIEQLAAKKKELRSISSFSLKPGTEFGPNGSKYSTRRTQLKNDITELEKKIAAKGNSSKPEEH